MLIIVWNKKYLILLVVILDTAVLMSIPLRLVGPWSTARGKCLFNLSAWHFALDKVLSILDNSVFVLELAISGYNAAGSSTVDIAFHFAWLGSLLHFIWFKYVVAFSFDAWYGSVALPSGAIITPNVHFASLGSKCFRVTLVFEAGLVALMILELVGCWHKWLYGTCGYMKVGGSNKNIC